MLVSNRMIRDPATITPEDLLIQAQLKRKGRISSASGRK